MEIKNAHILITGGNRGIGLAVAEIFAEAGAYLYLPVRILDEKLKENLLHKGAASVEVFQADLASQLGVAELLQRMKNVPLDILFNNAGQLTGGLLEEQNIDQIYSMFQVNLNALIQLSQGVLPGMLHRKKGKIINNSSVTGVLHLPCASTYAATKSAVIAFTNSLSIELKDTGVSTLLLITPGIKTRMFDEIPKLYGKNMDVGKLGSITPKEYALRIREAILEDFTTLKPRGQVGMMLKVATHTPAVFAKIIRSQFKR